MFTGAFTALITPFRNGRLDESRLTDQIEHQIINGIDGLVPVGTTGEYANATQAPDIATQLNRLQQGGVRVRQHNMRLHAGHGLNYRNVTPVARIPDMAELNIGHAIISRALFTGLQQAVREMKNLLTTNN